MDEIDINKVVNEMEVVSQFQQEPVPLDIVPASQRVQGYLAERYGAVWYSAHVSTLLFADGVRMHTAFILYPTGIAVRGMAEAPDGTLTEGQDLEEEEPTLQSNPQPDQRECLEQIMPALIRLDKMVKASDKKKAEKRWLRGQIGHVVKHLMGDIALQTEK